MGSFRLYIPIFWRGKKKVKIIYYKKLLFFINCIIKLLFTISNTSRLFSMCFSGDILMLLLEVRIFICSLQLPPKGEWRDRQ